jgi:hypothetical protein
MAGFSWSNLRPLAFAFNHYIAIPLLGDSELALRLGPLIAGALSIPLAGLAVRRWYGDAAGLGAVFMVALSPVLVVHSQFARYYMQAMVLSGVLLFCLRQWSDTRRVGWLGASLLSFLLGWFTVQSTSFVLPGFLLWAAWNPRDSGLAAAAGWVRAHPFAAALLAGGGALLAGWLLQRLLGADGESLVTTLRYYSAPALVLSLASGLGPAVALVALAGAPLCWTDPSLRCADQTFLPLVALGTIATFAAAFPFLAVGPAHVLSATALPLAGLAGYVLGRLALTTAPAALGTAVAASVLLLGIRELVSTQIDGGRPDYPWAIALVRERAGQQAPLVYATSHGVASYYAPELNARELLVTPDSLAWVRDTTRRRVAFAIVAETRRGPEVGEQLLGVGDTVPACRLAGRRERTRLDYSVAAVRVYECPPPGLRVWP